jgi:hypothetical protein
LTRPKPGVPATLTIQFSRQIARQCRAPGPSRTWEWAVCDAIANGSRHPTGRTGPGGGPVVRFERTLPPGAPAPAGPRRARAVIRVLAEILPEACLALRLLAPGFGRGKISNESGFLNRADPK